ncbi:MAG: alpha/beta hydrolase [Solirubrobacteraceae bacterium]|nr:alpha/beta hydrolase [Solirubrobacteraceae bacterium]
MTAIQRRTTTVDGRTVAWRHADPPAGAPLTVYVHGVPTSGADWEPFLERTGGVAPDQPGFGDSDPLPDPTMHAQADAIGAFVDATSPDPVDLVVHDWGATGLLWALRCPDRVRRLVILNTVPLTPGYRWHPMARLWRTRGLGEAAMAAPGPLTAWLASHRTPLTREPVPAALRGPIARGFPAPTKRTVLGLYRSADPDALVAAGRGLAAFAGRATIVWGVRDPFIPSSFADAMADAIGDGHGGPAALHRVDAGHWPWTSRPETIDLVAAALTD